MQRAERRAGLAARGGIAMRAPRGGDAVRQTKSSLWTAGLLLALVVGCTAPAGDVRPGGVPADLMIAVEIDGKAVAPIDAARLDALAPDYVDEHRRAWRLGALLGAAYVGTDMELEAEQRDGTRTIFARPTDAAAGREPVILVNRNGDVVMALLDVGEPFPGFHGRGGNRGRAGDPDRIRDVTRIRLSAAQAR